MRCAVIRTTSGAVDMTARSEIVERSEAALGRALAIVAEKELKFR